MSKLANILNSSLTLKSVIGFILGLALGGPAQGAPEDVSYTYDEARTGYYNTGQLTSLSNEAATILYDYDSHGQLVRERYLIDGQTYIRTYSYDEAGRLRKRSFSDGEVWPPSNGQYQYDQAGRLISIPGAINQVTYNSFSDIAQVDYANGTRVEQSYNLQREWLLGTKLTKGAQVLFEEQYTRDTLGRITKIRSNRANGNWDYSYDGVNRLSAATNVGNSALTRSFTYSPSGNLLSKSDVGTYSYPAPTAARPHAPTKAGSWTFSYDGNGNMVSGKGRTITYDGKDRPISVTMGGVTTQYVYGPDGARLKKISGGQTTLYLGTDEEILPDGTVIKHLDGSVRRVGTTTNWLHRDHLSSVRMLTNSAGDIAAVSRYQPYGKRTDVQQAADTPRESKGWIGERDDPETGLTYLNARYYDADLAQFLQADWLNPTHPYVGTNRYSYALNNPIAFKDPTGNYAIDDGELDAVVVYSDYDPCSGLCEGGYGYRGPGRDEDRNPTSRYKHVQIAQAKVLQLSVVPGYYPGVNLSQNQALAEFEQDFFDYIITNGPASHVMYGAAYLTYGSIYLQNQEVDANGKKKAQDPPVPGAKPGQKTKGRTQQWEKPGDFQDALKDYKDKNPEKVKSLPDGGEVGKLPDGRMINVRPYSSDNRPTIEIQDGKNRIKIRYGD